MVIWLYLKELKSCMEILCSNVIFPLQIYANWPRDLYMYNYITLTVNSPRILEINRCLFLADAFNHTSFNISGLIKQNKGKLNAMYFTRGGPAIASSFSSTYYSFLFCSLVSLVGTSSTRVTTFWPVCTDALSALFWGIWSGSCLLVTVCRCVL